MKFRSDNCAGAHPKVCENMTRNAGGFASSYGASDLDNRVKEKFCDLFGREVAVFFVGTGTAANSLALAAVNRPGGVVFCHPEAHMAEDECGAPEYFTVGARLCGVDGALGRMDIDRLQPSIDRYPADFVHAGQPMAVSITQSTEIGTLYSLDDIAAISSICRKNGLPLHMDGARFANAMVSLDVSAARMTVERGVDIISFGGTKNGCWCAEALVFLIPISPARLRSCTRGPHSSFQRAGSSPPSSRRISRTISGWNWLRAQMRWPRALRKGSSRRTVAGWHGCRRQMRYFRS